MCEDPRNITIAVVGDSLVGKTAVVSRFVDGTFQETTATIALNALSKKVVIDDKEFNIKIFDTPSQRKQYKNLLRSCYRDSDIIIIVFAVGDPETDEISQTSFESLEGWLDDAQSSKPDAIFCFCGNLKDIKSRKITHEAAVKRVEELCKKCMYFETSAATGDGVDDMFISLIKKYIQQKDAKKPEEPQEKNNGSPCTIF
ncbi:Rab family GTPase [Histomonas meleagridis]|nr:Rab family GTPase [Histomonas meleagridis]